MAVRCCEFKPRRNDVTSGGFRHVQNVRPNMEPHKKVVPQKDKK